MKNSDNRTSSSSVIVHFTPTNFFAAAKQLHGTPCSTKDASNPAKRPPKLMDRQVDLPKKSKQVPSSQIQPTNNQGGHNGKHQSGRQSYVEIGTSKSVSANPRHPQQHLRREHSASIVVPSRRNLSATFLRYTPPANKFDQQDFSSPVFAGSKFIESPSAKSLPLPPSQWLDARVKLPKQEAGEKKQNGGKAERIMGNENTADTTMGNENFNLMPSNSNWSPPASAIDANSPSGVRIHPLHLIAAAVTSP